MKVSTLFLFLLICSIGTSQSLPIDFETTITTEDFIDFDGGIATVISNPQVDEINSSGTVAQIIRNGGQIWAGSKIELNANLDFTTLNTISMKVFTTAPMGTQVKLKIEGGGSIERDVQTTVSGEWEVLTWDFTGEGVSFNEVVFMFDFGNLGDGSATSTFLFDDIEQLFGGSQIDLPVNFEDPDVNYTMTDFEGNSSLLTVDPADADNTVVQCMKTDQASPSAGTTIGTPSGFASDIPLTLTDSKMNVRVWSPMPGTPIRLKVEDSKDPTHTCETETNTTVGGEWETLEFDFLNQAPGTELLSVGLDMGWTYNKASIFFNFATAEDSQSYYFDDVKFGEAVLNNTNIEDAKVSVFPNPTEDSWNITSDNSNIERIDIFNISGALILSQYPNKQTFNIDARNLMNGIYTAKIYTDSGTVSRKMIKN